MSVIKFKGKEKELKYTFNSFKYMQELDLSVLEEVESKPFKIIPLMETLLLGALNYDPKERATLVEVDKFLDEFFNEDGDIGSLLEELMGLLQESSFFKSLQKKAEKTK